MGGIQTPMNPLAPISEPTPGAESAMPGIVIIYDDRASGFQAKRFSDMLAASLGHPGQAAPVCWRSELMDLPGVAAEMRSDAARSEFVILSLRGNRGLSVEMKEWIEGWLAAASGGPSSLIALFDRERSIATYAESVRCYLRQVSFEAGIPFFAHCTIAMNAAEELFAEEDEEAIVVRPERRRRRRRARSTIFQATAAA
jgi:hypothetical protein